MKDIKIRKKFRKFFEGLDHRWYSSISLVPDDPSMLFTTAGMVQFKKQFLGEAGAVTRAASIQKCLRTSDIDEVGKTSRHLTFFEMYGNFSFGDYFKKEAIMWAWDFLNKTMKLDPRKLYASVYQDDDEAYAIWKGYLPEERIVKLGEKDNFWKMGDTGPCGPCSEILYDRGPGTGCGKEGCGPGCSCDRYLEVWNLVFTQYDRKASGELEELPKKNIDTGMGLERLNQVIGGSADVFETPTIKPLMEKIQNESENYSLESARIIADHSRAVTFMIADGVSPANEGRGYVLRRLIRRAVREGKKLGWHEPGLYKYTSLVVDIMSEYYPVLADRANHIASVCRMEEEGFLNTLDTAMRILDGYIKELRSAGDTILPAEKAFKLYDTYGMPLEITKNILSEKGIATDEKGYEKFMEERVKSTEWKEADASKSYWDDIRDIKDTEFIGYGSCSAHAVVVKVISSGTGLVLNKTPMYPESGGQVGDRGTIKSKDGIFTVKNTVREEGIIIHEGVLDGRMIEGEDVEVQVEGDVRKATERNHTATHILQSVLREMLGEHVQQNGSLVEPDRLRFDFTHTDALSQEQLREVEVRVNRIIVENHKINTTQMDKDEAREKGALAFFGEKYGEKVRAVTIGGLLGNKVSMELCGGTHLESTGEIGLFKISSESGIAAGVRRIEAVTGDRAVRLMHAKEDTARGIAEMLGVPEDRIPDRIERMKEELRDCRNKINELENRLISRSGEKGELDRELDLGDVKLVIKQFNDTSISNVRVWVDSSLKQGSYEGDKGVAVLAVSISGEKISLVLKIPEYITDRADAGKVMKEAAGEIGGSGGGRKDMAQGGGTEKSRIGKAVEVIERFLRP
ncbi:MAG: alanine--tRNA ligase [Elusimicrobia bacterium]|nr:alanine--tRNA ligase [Elusimicrobiota bacterium]